MNMTMSKKQMTFAVSAGAVFLLLGFVSAEDTLPPDVPAPELCDAEPDFTCHVAGLPLCCSSDPSTCTTSDGNCTVW